MGVAIRAAVAGQGRAGVCVRAGKGPCLDLARWTVFTLATSWPADPSLSDAQNPPAIPTLPLATLAAKVRGSRLVIDWHNTGHSILALRLGIQHRVVKMAKWFVSRESLWFGRSRD